MTTFITSAGMIAQLQTSRGKKIPTHPWRPDRLTRQTYGKRYRRMENANYYVDILVLSGWERQWDSCCHVTRMYTDSWSIDIRTHEKETDRIVQAITSGDRTQSWQLKHRQDPSKTREADRTVNAMTLGHFKQRSWRNNWCKDIPNTRLTG